MSVSSMPGLASLSPQEMIAQATPAPGPNQAGNAEAAKQFEGMVMAYLFQQMRQTVQPSNLFGDQGQARSTYEFLLDQAVTSQAMQAGKGYGLSQRLETAWNSRTTKSQNNSTTIPGSVRNST